MEGGSWKNKIKEHGLVLLLFVVLVFVFTYPSITQLTTHTIGEGGDAHIFKWNIWYINRVLTEGGGISDVYYTEYMFYPEGTTLTHHSYSLTNTFFLGFPLTLLTDNLVLIYNILIIFNFVLAGFGMYLLIKYLTNDKAIGFLAAFSFAFSAFAMAKALAHLNILSIGWSPLFFLFFIKMFRERKISNAIFAAIFLFFLTLACWFHLLFIFLISFFYFIYNLIFTRSFLNRHYLVRLIVFLVLFIVTIFPFITPVVTEYFAVYGIYGKGGIYEGEEWEERTGRSGMIHPIYYVLPSELHSFWRSETLHQYYLRYRPYEDYYDLPDTQVFLGYFVLLLVFLFLIIIRKQIFWLVIAILFFIFSVSPYGIITDLLFRVFYLHGFVEEVSRFAFGVLFSVTIIFGFSLKFFLPKWINFLKERLKINQKTAKFSLIFLIFSFLTLESIPIPYITTYGNRKELTILEQLPYLSDKTIISQESTVFIFPFRPAPTGHTYHLYLQTFHEKKMIIGESRRAQPHSLRSTMELWEIINTKDTNAFSKFITDYNVGHIIFFPGWYWPGLENGEIKKNFVYLLEHANPKLIFEDAAIGMYIYEALPPFSRQ